MAIARAAKKRGTVVYFILGGKYLKVGISDRLKVRIGQLQSGNPYKLVLLKALKTTNPLADERRFHKILKPFHVLGEWFEVPEHHPIMQLLKGKINP